MGSSGENTGPRPVPGDGTGRPAEALDPRERATVVGGSSIGGSSIGGSSIGGSSGHGSGSGVPGATSLTDSSMFETRASPSAVPDGSGDYQVTRDGSGVSASAATVGLGGGAPGESLFGATRGGSGIGEGNLPQIEGYEAVSCLGRGGMGVVFQGVQEATGRKVAIKFLLDAGLASAAARQRFEREVEVVAGLQHPGIVSILDSGVKRGRYYYVMDFVEGKPLDEAMTPGKCDVRAALTLVRGVCEAVDYAHQRGVLHRDLKPSNILVDAEMRPRLLDFGLAKQVDSAGAGTSARVGTHSALGLTVAEPGQLLGTVAYMSPEQSVGRADQTSVRTDVYSLGVIAYELLTGRLPVLMDGSLRDVLARIAEQDPPPPSSIVRSLDRDVDAMLLKALEKVPERRYATAGEFAADIRRYLSDEPITARRVSPAGRAARWVKRNSALSATIAGAAAVLVITSGVLVARIVEERDRANAAAAENLRNFQLAARNEQLAKEALAQAVMRERDAQQNFSIMRDILESADPDRPPDPSRPDRAGEPTVRQILDAATARMDTQPPDQPLTEASVREVLGSVYRKLGVYDKAQENLTKAVAIRRRLATGDDATLADAIHRLAAVLWWEGDYDRAQRLYTESLEMRRRLHSGDHRDIATSLTHLAACWLRMGRNDEAHELYTEALAMRRRLLGPEHEEVAQALNNLAKSYLEDEEYEKAEELFRQALDMVTRLKGEQYSGTAAASQNLATCLLEMGRPEEARVAFQAALDIRSRLFPSGHPQIASSQVGLSQALLAMGQMEEARTEVEGALALFTRTGRTRHPDFAEASAMLARVHLAQGQVDRAIPLLRQALEILGTTKPPAAVQQAVVQGDLGAALATMGDTDEAESLLTSSATTLYRLREGRGRLVAIASERLAGLYERTGRTEKAAEARAAAARALAAAENQGQPSGKAPD